MKKTKAQLEKELIKVQKELAKTLEKIKVRNNREWKEPVDVNYYHVEKITETKAPSQPSFIEIIDNLSNQLKSQNEWLDITISKISHIDGGLCFENSKNDKVYINGVCGALNQLIDLSIENNSRIQIINSRLTNLVG